MKNSRCLNVSNFWFPKVFHRKGLKKGGKKVHGKSLTVRLWKNSVNFISNGPILLVWLTHRKFELEGLIRKLFTVIPRTTSHHLFLPFLPLPSLLHLSRVNWSYFTEPNCDRGLYFPPYIY